MAIGLVYTLLMELEVLVVNKLNYKLDMKLILGMTEVLITM